LYNLAKDIGKTDNVAAEHPQLVAEFEAFILSARTPSPSWPTPPD